MGWFADEERKIELQQEIQKRLQKEMMLNLSVSQVIKGVREYYKDPLAYRENKKLELFFNGGVE